MFSSTDSIDITDTTAIVDGTSNTVFPLVSNIMKLRHDAASTAIKNVR